MASDEAGMSVSGTDDELFQRRVLAVLQEGRPGTTMCPSDVARKLDPEGWRALMARVRDAAFTLADVGAVEVTQRGVVVEGRRARGAIRLRPTRC